MGSVHAEKSPFLVILFCCYEKLGGILRKAFDNYDMVFWGSSIVGANRCVRCEWF